jgi:hypothetical protein
MNKTEFKILMDLHVLSPPEYEEMVSGMLSVFMGECVLHSNT